MDANNNLEALPPNKTHDVEALIDTINTEKSATLKLGQISVLNDLHSHSENASLKCEEQKNKKNLCENESQNGETQPKKPQVPPPKSSDKSTKHPFTEFSEYSWGINLIRLIVFLFDVITYPIYVLIQKPWVNRKISRRTRAQLENPNDPYSAYVRVKKFTNRSHYAFKPQTIPEYQQLSLKLSPRNSLSLGYREIVSVTHETQRNGKRMMKLNLTDYKWLTIEEVDERITNLHKSFLANGVKFQERVLIFSETRMGWWLCAQALWRIGAVVATLFPTLGKEGIIYGINETEVEHVVTTEDLVSNLLKVIHRLPKVRKIYVIELHPGLVPMGKTTQASVDVITGNERKVELLMYRDMLEQGSRISDDQYEYTSPKPNDVAVILYTSGSTGNPKGVIQTHLNFCSAVQGVYDLLGEKILDEPSEHCYFALLPLAHSLEMAAELIFFGLGVKIGYGTPFTMTDASTAILPGQKGDLKLLRPTVLAGVPLVLDRIRKSLTDRFEGKHPFWKQLYKYMTAYKNFWIDHGYDTPLVNHFICKRVQGQLGGNLRFMIIGGAPLSPDTQKVMRAFLNVKLLIGYGSTETCAGSCISDFDDMEIGTIGAPLEGVKLRLIDWPEGGYFVTDKPNPRGEIVIGGNCITKGYFKLPKQTLEAYEVDEKGIQWFKMGDIGEVYPNGNLRIVDRKKDLVKLQQGEYISLGKVEAELKNFKYAENVCVYGDSMHLYMIAFISPSIANLKKLAISLGFGNETLEQWCKNPKILNLVQTDLIEFGREAGLNKMEIPQKIKLCHEEWSVATGMLTGSMKINRRNVQQFYKDYIGKMYNN